MQGAPHSEVASVTDREQAAVLLQHPLRLQILEHAREPISASRIAERIGAKRQNINYHVRQLASARLLKRAGRRRRGNMYEQRYVASAKSYAVSAEVLGPLGAHRRAVTDKQSADHLMSLGELMTSELGRSMQAAADAEQRLATLSINTTLGFNNKRQRAAFARALSEAVADVVGRFATHSDPETCASGAYRLVVGCYPVARDGQDTEELNDEQA